MDQHFDEDIFYAGNKIFCPIREYNQTKIFSLNNGEGCCLALSFQFILDCIDKNFEDETTLMSLLSNYSEKEIVKKLKIYQTKYVKTISGTFRPLNEDLKCISTIFNVENEINILINDFSSQVFSIDKIINCIIQNLDSFNSFLLGLHYGQGRHCVALFFNTHNISFYFFDPNYGLYVFRKDELNTFLDSYFKKTGLINLDIASLNKSS